MAALPRNVLQTTIAGKHRKDCQSQSPQCRRVARNAGHDIAGLAQQCVVEIASGTVLIRNANTTIGHCRFTRLGDIEYIFVNPICRRRGHGSRLLEGLRALIGFATLDSDEIDANGDRRFFDEECFLRYVPGAGRFQLDTLAPVAGSGVIVGSKGNSAELADPVIGAGALAARVRVGQKSRPSVRLPPRRQPDWLYLSRMSFLTDFTPATPRANSAALLMSACEFTKPLN